MIYKIKLILKQIGWNVDKTISFFKGLPFYFKDLKELKKQKGENNDFEFANPIPILDEKTESAGIMSGQYFHQDLYVAQLINKNNPIKHVDIGSRIDGFVAHVASFREIEIFDIRNQKSNVENITFKKADLMDENQIEKEYCDSISCLHAIEHFGLGRYGDPIDYFGHIKALENIYGMLKKDGKFYFSTPIGKSRIQFNAHRIFSVKYLMKLFEGKYKIDSFSYINDDGNLIKDSEITKEKIESNFDCKHGCGIFKMTKL